MTGRGRAARDLMAARVDEAAAAYRAAVLDECRDARREAVRAADELWARVAGAYKSRRPGEPLPDLGITNELLERGEAARARQRAAQVLLAEAVRAARARRCGVMGRDAVQGAADAQS